MIRFKLAVTPRQGSSTVFAVPQRLLIPVRGRPVVSDSNPVGRHRRQPGEITLTGSTGEYRIPKLPRETTRPHIPMRRWLVATTGLSWAALGAGLAAVAQFVYQAQTLKQFKQFLPWLTTAFGCASLASAILVLVGYLSAVRRVS